MKRHSVLLVLIIVVFPLSPRAQDAPPRRPVIGIALSGGGALGLAHIGVLRYLQEHRIPVDRIAGTSIGGLLGGLYATGHDTASLEQIVRETDWENLLRTAPKFEDRPVAEKQEWNHITGRYSLQLAKGFALPAGLNPAQSLVLLLSGETSAYADVQNFDDLPIPFRCVATDLLSGEAFVLDRGYLTKALRATMAIPGVFTPVEWEGRVLSDGGLVNNLPTDVVKAMGAEVIIGVTLRVSPTNNRELESITSILRQSMNIALVQNELRNVSLADINIEVPLGNRRTLDFSDTKSIIELGYEAAVRNQTALNRLSVSPDQWERYIRTRESRERMAPLSGPLVAVSASPPVVQMNAASELARKTGAQVSREHLEETLSGLTAATGLPNAFYGWHRDAERSGYRVELEPRPDSQILIRPSFFYQFSPGEPGRPTFRLSTTAISKDAYKSRLLADMHFGPNPAIFVEYYHPFDGRAYLIAPGFSLQRTQYSAYDDNERRSARRDRFATSLYAGIGTWRQAQLRIGAQAGFDRYSSPASPISDGSLPTSNTSFLNPEITGTINSQDSGQLPTHGFRMNGAGGWSFREHSYPYLRLNFDHFQPLRRDVSVFAIGQTDTSFGRKLTFYDRFTAGGLTHLDAYRDQELRGDTILAAGGGVLYRGANPKGTAFRPIFGSWYEAASVNSVEQDAQFRQSATIGVFAPTPLGLAGLTLSLDFKGSARFRFSIGSFWNHP
jgi:NTE family protein